MRSRALCVCAAYVLALSGCVNYVGKPDALMFVSAAHRSAMRGDLPPVGSRFPVALRPSGEIERVGREPATAPLDKSRN
jgi:hypothetical protein